MYLSGFVCYSLSLVCVVDEYVFALSSVLSFGFMSASAVCTASLCCFSVQFLFVLRVRPLRGRMRLCLEVTGEQFWVRLCTCVLCLGVGMHANTRVSGEAGCRA